MSNSISFERWRLDHSTIFAWAWELLCNITTVHNVFLAIYLIKGIFLNCLQCNNMHTLNMVEKIMAQLQLIPLMTLLFFKIFFPSSRNIFQNFTNGLWNSYLKKMMGKFQRIKYPFQEERRLINRQKWISNFKCKRFKDSHSL